MVWEDVLMNIRFGYTNNFDASFLDWTSLCSRRVFHTDEAACGPNRLTKLVCGGVFLLTRIDTLMGGGDREAHRNPSRRWVSYVPSKTPTAQALITSYDIGVTVYWGA
jgi:hypothetical protein